MDSWGFPSGADGSTSQHITDPLPGSGHNTPTQARPALSRDPSSPPSPDVTQARQAASNSRIRRRNRLITSCLECRRRKLKCDKTAPCTNCTRFKRNCLYLAPTLDASSQQKLADIKEKMGALEKNLEKEIVGSRKKTRKADGPSLTIIDSADPHGDGDDDDLTPDEEEEALEPTPLADLDSVDDGDEELVDLGVSMGKLRISDRIGGWLRPKFHDELSGTLGDSPGSKMSSGNPSQADIMAGRVPTGMHRMQAAPRSFIGHGPDYIAPSNAFFFPGTNMNTTLIDYLPSKLVADRLLQQYWDAVHYMCRMVHRPTFEAQYHTFWRHIAADVPPTPQLQALMFAAMFSAAVSMSEVQAVQYAGVSRHELIDSLRSGTEMALAKANFLKTTKVETMQAFVMYLIPQVRAEVSRAHSALVGTAIRLAECMGLHRDGMLYNMKPIEVHVRRMIWHQLCFLDMRTCDATGPRPQIKKEDYDTRLPWNVNDVDLLNPQFVPEDKKEWTDATFLRMRCEVIEARRQSWFDTIQIDKKKKTITQVLMRCHKSINTMEAFFLPLMDPNDPFQALARLNLEVGMKSLHTQVLHRYLVSTTQRMPDRLRQVLIEACLVVLENSVVFETSPAMQQWAWYRGAYNQYHTALLLLIEVYAYPMRREAPRIWKVLDYIFEVEPRLPPKQKAEIVLTDLRDRMDVFHQLRKIKISAKMEQRVSDARSRSSSVAPANAMVDADGQMLQQDDGMIKSAYSPPSQMESPGANVDFTRHGSMVNNPDLSVPTMEDIDWREWDQVFDPTVNTGELNIPNFDMSNFTGSGAGGGGGVGVVGGGGGNAGAADFNTAPHPAAGYDLGTEPTDFSFMNHGLPMNVPEASNFADVSFNTTLMPLVTQPPPHPPQSTQGQLWGNIKFRDY